MKVKTGPPKSKTPRKSLPGGVQKKKFSKPTGTIKAVHNIVKITDAFEDLKAGNDLIGITCSKEPKVVKKSAAKAKASKDAVTKTDGKVPKNTVVKKNKADKLPLAPKQKKPKKDTTDGAPKASLKSKTLESCLATNDDAVEPKLDIEKVNFNTYFLRFCSLSINRYFLNSR